MVANARLQLEQITIEATAVTRPWALPDKPYNTRATVETWLKPWGSAGLWNYRRYRELQRMEPRAVRGLARDLVQNFGLSPAAAEREARRIDDLVIRSRFMFPANADPADLVERERLQALILAGAPTRRLRPLLANLSEAGVAPRPDSCSPGMEPFLFSALERPRIMRLLLDAGASVDERNGFGKTALMSAAHFDLLPAARLLLARKADVNARIGTDEPYPLRITGRTALMYAAENASYGMIALLLRAGADPAAVDSAKHDVFVYLSRNTLMPPRDHDRAAALLHAALARKSPTP